MFHYPVTTTFWRGAWDYTRVRGILRRSCDWHRIYFDEGSYNNPTCADCLAYKAALAEIGERLLIITDMAKQRAAEIVAYARIHQNWYVPGQTSPPSSMTQLCHFFEPSILASFSWTYDAPNQKIYRQLSLRSAKLGRLPHADTAYTIASWFGFTGASLSEAGIVYKSGADWIIQPWKEHDTLIISQEISHEEYSKSL
jgi:hypothetical protein